MLCFLFVLFCCNGQVPQEDAGPQLGYMESACLVSRQHVCGLWLAADKDGPPAGYPSVTIIASAADYWAQLEAAPPSNICLHKAGQRPGQQPQHSLQGFLVGIRHQFTREVKGAGAQSATTKKNLDAAAAARFKETVKKNLNFIFTKNLEDDWLMSETTRRRRISSSLRLQTLWEESCAQIFPSHHGHGRRKGI